MRESNPRVNWRTGQLQWDIPGRDLASEKRRRRRPSSKPTTLRAYLIMKRAKEVELEPRPKVLKQYREFSDLFNGKLPIGILKHSV